MNKPENSFQHFFLSWSRALPPFLVTLFLVSGFLAGVVFSWQPWYAVPAFTSSLKGEAVVHAPETLILVSGLVITALSLAGSVMLLFRGCKSRWPAYCAWGMVVYTLTFPVMVPVLAAPAHMQGSLFNFEQNTVHDFLFNTGLNTHIPWTPTLQVVAYPEIYLTQLDAFKGVLTEDTDDSQMTVVSFLAAMGFKNTFYNYLKPSYIVVLMASLGIILIHSIYIKEQFLEYAFPDVIAMGVTLTIICFFLSWAYIPGNYHYYRASSHENRGLRNQALSNYKKSFNFLPGLKHNCSTLFHMGKIHHHRNQHDSGFYWFYKAITLLKNNKTQKAEHCLVQALKYLPDNPTVNYLLYYTLCNQGIERYETKAYQSAASLFQEALLYFPMGLTALYNLGLTCILMEDFDQANMILKRFRALAHLYVRPSEITHCRIQFLMAWSHFQRGNLDRAMDRYRQGLTLPTQRPWNNIFTRPAPYVENLYPSAQQKQLITQKIGSR